MDATYGVTRIAIIIDIYFFISVMCCIFHFSNRSSWCFIFKSYPSIIYISQFVLYLLFLFNIKPSYCIGFYSSCTFYFIFLSFNNQFKKLKNPTLHVPPSLKNLAYNFRCIHKKYTFFGLQIVNLLFFAKQINFY